MVYERSGAGVPSFSRRCRGFAAERRADTRYRSTAAAAGHPAAVAPQHGTQQRIRAVSRRQLT